MKIDFYGRSENNLTVVRTIDPIDSCIILENEF